jgi:hypothetical protein
MKKNIIFTAIAAFAIGGLLGGFVAASKKSDVTNLQTQIDSSAERAPSTQYAPTNR